MKTKHAKLNKLWDGKRLGTALGNYLFYLMATYISLGFAHFILYFVIFYYAVFNKRARTSSWDFLKRVYPKLNPIKRAFMVYRHIYSFGLTLVDRMYYHGRKIPVREAIIGYENLHKVLEKKKGAVILHSHIGGYNLALKFQDKYKTKLNILMYKHDSDYMKKWIQKFEGGESLHIIDLDNKTQAVFDSIAALNRNELIGVMADRAVEEQDGNILVNFFGEEVPFPKGVWMIPAITHVPALVLFSIREKEHYKFIISEPIYIDYDRNRSDETLKIAIEKYASILEDIARKYPLQWFNFFKYWDQKKVIYTDDKDVAKKAS